MLEKPDLQDERVISGLWEAYGLRTVQVEFLPLGADVNTAVYRLVTEDETAYFLKLRKGAFDEMTVAVPQFLKTQGLKSIIAPMETKKHQLWGSLDAYKMILYPFIQGRNGYEAALSDKQWVDFGAALRVVHTAQVPPDLAGFIQREVYSLFGRETVRTFQAQVENKTFEDPVAAKLAAFMRSRYDEIRRLVDRAGQLGIALQARPLEFVLCHADIHAGNLLLEKGGRLYIVDWDNPIFAPKERDLALIGGSATWSDPRQVALFYQGYGPAQVDPMALAYYRYERIIQDIAEFCKQLLLNFEGGEDREQSYQYFTSGFLPKHDIDLARGADELWRRQP